jgi:hypothetical protein
MLRLVSAVPLPARILPGAALALACAGPIEDPSDLATGHRQESAATLSQVTSVLPCADRPMPALDLADTAPQRALWLLWLGAASNEPAALDPLLGSLGFTRVQRFGRPETASGLVLDHPTCRVVAFSGSDSASDWATNVRGNLRSAQPLAGRVHAGFAGALDELMPELTPLLEGEQRLCLTGFSQGGALAELLAARLAGTRALAPLAVFAAPRPGNGEFAEALRAALGSDVRIYASSSDPVPRLPPLAASAGAALAFWEPDSGAGALAKRAAVLALQVADYRHPGALLVMRDGALHDAGAGDDPAFYEQLATTTLEQARIALDDAHRAGTYLCQLAALP